MATTKITDADFQEVIRGDKPVLVDFWATWCGPCKMMAPVLEDLSDQHGEKLSVAKLDVDENPATTAEFGIMSIPTLILFVDGQPVKQIVGYQPKDQLEAELADVLA